MSYSDIQTKKIYGAKEGSIAYHHEMGHIIFNETLKGVKNSYRQQFNFNIAVTAFILGFFFSKALLYSSVVFILLFWYYFLYEEMWCWNYAYQKKSKKLKGGLIK